MDDSTGNKLFEMQKPPAVLSIITIILSLSALPFVSDANVSGSFEYTVDEGKVTITKFVGDQTAVIVPESIEGLPVTSIGQTAFFKCSNLTSVSIPATVTDIEPRAFDGCSSLASVSIPSSVESIGYEAFSNCSSLNILQLGNGLKELGRDAFIGCASLVSLNIPAGLDYMGDRCFQDCTNLKQVTIGQGVQVIASSVFSGCRNLTSVSLPSSVTSIGPHAFDRCTSLTAIQLPYNLLRIGEKAFVSCNSLTSVFIPSRVTSLGTGVFLACQNLVSVYMPVSLTIIGESAFQGCISLKKIFIPKDVAIIGDKAFYKCYSLESIEVALGNDYYESVDGVLFNDSMTRLLQFPFGRGGAYRIPDGVTRIDNCAFAQSDKLTSIIMPSSVTELLNRTFESCVSLTCVFYLGEPPSLAGNHVFAYAHPDLIHYFIYGNPGWEAKFAGRPTSTFTLWFDYPQVRLMGSKYVNTGDWLGWLEVSSKPWIWCTSANSWLYIDEEVVEASHGWIFIVDLAEEAPGLWLYRMPGTDWGWSYGLGKWLYVGEESLESGAGWVYLL